MQVRILAGVLSVLCLTTASISPAYGQATATLTGTVLDTTGAALPAATITAHHTGTNVATDTITTAQGTFSIPALPPGTYTVTVTLDGFKTGVYQDVVLNAGVPTALAIRLEVGGIAETITVEGASALVQTVSSAVSSTISTQQIQNVPLPTRNVLDFVTRLPGVETAGALRGSSINGLRRGAINITLDGVNVQDNTLRSTDGFATIVQPRLDAIAEVTVSMAAGEVAGASQGAVQIRFTTRSGTNQYTGSLYHYYRHDALNENTWFNTRDGVDTPELLQHQRGGRLGGPIRIPGIFDGRGRAFFFTNIENFYQPSEVTRNRTILHERARAGMFRYLGAGNAPVEVDLLQVAAASGQTATMDPTIQKLLADIRAATTTTGSVTASANPLYETYTYNLTNVADNWFPTYRVDYNLSSSHRLSTVWNWHTFSSAPDTLNNAEPFFPGFPVMGSQTSRRGSSSNTLRSTVGQNRVNEFRVGWQGSPVEFFNEQFNAAIWDQPFGGQGGFHLGLNVAGITNAGREPSASARNVNILRIENTLSWLKGAHSLNVGGMFDRRDSWNKFRNTVPTVTFGMGSTDPALGMFNTTNFPGASAANLTAARNLYALLTGRVTQTSVNARLDASTGKYVYAGLGLEESRLDNWGLYAQDSWRVRPNLGLNLGVRWDIQAPFRARNSSYSTATIDSIWGVSGYRPGCDLSGATPATCNLFKPGEMPGQPTAYLRWEKDTPAYNVDWNNIAPSVGFNWTPERRGGLLGALMGPSGDFAIRGGFARAFQQPGVSDYRARFASNPGLSFTVLRNQSEGNLGPLPALFRDAATRLGPPLFPDEPVYPMAGLITHSVNALDPNIQIPYADTWTAGFQRALSRNLAVEARWVGTRSRQQWTTYNYNELNIIENGLLNEFRLAQQNLQANIAAGVAAQQGFRYRGPGTGTHPLPIIFAYFQGTGDPHNAAAYTSTLFTNATFLNPLSRFNPNPFTFGNALDSEATRRANALNAGLPANFLRANPHKLGGALVTGHGGYSNYNSVQFEIRRRLGNGFQADASYVYGVGENSGRYSLRVPRETITRAGLTEGEVTHALKTNWMFELPFGQGRRFASHAGRVLDRIVGGWQIHGFLRVQSGSWVDFGNVRMVGFTEKDLWKMYTLRIDENRRVFMLPQDVVDNTLRAFNTSPTSITGYGGLGAPEGRYFAPAMGPDCLETIAAGYGECGTRTLSVRGPLLKEADISVMKVVPIVGRVRAEFRAEMMNAFNWVNFVPVAPTGANVANPAQHEVSGLRGAHTARLIQLVSRLSW